MSALRDAMIHAVLGWVKPAQPLAETLPARLDAILHGLSFGKTMVWTAGGMRFSRPVRWQHRDLLPPPVVPGSSLCRRRPQASCANGMHGSIR